MELKFQIEAHLHAGIQTRNWLGRTLYVLRSVVKLHSFIARSQDFGNVIYLKAYQENYSTVWTCGINRPIVLDISHA